MYQPSSSYVPWSIGDVAASIGQAFGGALQARRQRRADDFSRVWQTYQALPPEMQKSMWPYVLSVAKQAGVNLPQQYVSAPDPAAAQKADARFRFSLQQLQNTPELRNDPAFMRSMAQDYHDAYGQDPPWISQTTPGTPAIPGTPAVQGLAKGTAANVPGAGGGVLRESPEVAGQAGTPEVPATPDVTTQVPFFAAQPAGGKTFGDALAQSPAGKQLAATLQAHGAGFMLDDPITSPQDLRASYDRAIGIIHQFGTDDKAALKTAIAGLTAQASVSNPKDPKDVARAQQAQDRLLQVGQKAVDQGLITPDEFSGMVYEAFQTAQANKMYVINTPDGPVTVNGTTFAKFETDQMNARAALGQVDPAQRRQVQGKLLEQQAKVQEYQAQYTDALSRIRADLDDFKRSPQAQNPRIQQMLKADPTGMNVLRFLAIRDPAVKNDLAALDKANSLLLAAQAGVKPYQDWLDDPANQPGGGAVPAAGPSGVPTSVPGAQAPGAVPPRDSQTNAVLTPDQFRAKAQQGGVTVQALKNAGVWDGLPPEYQQVMTAGPAAGPPPSGGAAPAPGPAPAPAPSQPQPRPQPAVPATAPPRRPAPRPSPAGPTRDTRETAARAGATAGPGDAAIDAELAAAARPGTISPPSPSTTAYTRAGIGLPPPAVPGQVPPPQARQQVAAGVGSAAQATGAAVTQAVQGTGLTTQQVQVLQRRWPTLSDTKRKALRDRLRIPRSLMLVLDHAAKVTTPP